MSARVCGRYRISARSRSSASTNRTLGFRRRLAAADSVRRCGRHQGGRGQGHHDERTERRPTASGHVRSTPCGRENGSAAVAGAIRSRSGDEQSGYSRSMRPEPCEAVRRRADEVPQRGPGTTGGSDGAPRTWEVTGPPSRTSICPAGRSRPAPRSSCCTGARPTALARSTDRQLTVRRMQPFVRSLAALGDDLAVGQLRYRSGAGTAPPPTPSPTSASRSTGSARSTDRCRWCWSATRWVVAPRCAPPGMPTCAAWWRSPLAPGHRAGGAARRARPGRAPRHPRPHHESACVGGLRRAGGAVRPTHRVPPGALERHGMLRTRVALAPVDRRVRRRHRRRRAVRGPLDLAARRPVRRLHPGHDHMSATSNLRLPRRRIAVVGAGVSGLTAAYVLQRECDVTLYEAEPRLGGHAHTHDVLTPDGRVLPIDSGFIVHNDRTYPNLLRLFGELGVETQPTDMSMSVRCDGCGLEYAGGRGLGGVFARPANVADAAVPADAGGGEALPPRPRTSCSTATASPPDGAPSRSASSSPPGATRRYFVPPLHGARWCRACGRARRGPRSLTRRAPVHASSTTTARCRSPARPTGARSSVGRAPTSNARRRSSPPTALVDAGAPVHRHRRRGRRSATTPTSSAPSTRWSSPPTPTRRSRLLADPTAAERDDLGAFGYSVNETVLHTDGSGAARATRRARARGTTCSTAATSRRRPVQVSYDMNRLHRLDEPTHYVVTLNAGRAHRRRRRHRAHAATRIRCTRAESVAAAGAAARARRRPARLRGRLPRLGLPRGRLPARASRAAASFGVSW